MISSKLIALMLVASLTLCSYTEATTTVAGTAAAGTNNNNNGGGNNNNGGSGNANQPLATTTKKHMPVGTKPMGTPPPTPTCDSVAPLSAPTNGNITVVIRGNNLHHCNGISFKKDGATMDPPAMKAAYRQIGAGQIGELYIPGKLFNFTGGHSLSIHCGASMMKTTTCQGTRRMTFSKPSEPIELTIPGNLADYTPTQQLALINDLTFAIAKSMGVDLSALTDKKLRAGSIIFSFRVLAVVGKDVSAVVQAFKDAAENGALLNALKALPTPITSVTASVGGVTVEVKAATTPAPTPSPSGATKLGVSMILLLLSVIQLLAL